MVWAIGELPPLGQAHTSVVTLIPLMIQVRGFPDNPHVGRRSGGFVQAYSHGRPRTSRLEQIALKLLFGPPSPA